LAEIFVHSLNIAESFDRDGISVEYFWPKITDFDGTDYFAPSLVESLGEFSFYRPLGGPWAVADDCNT